MDKCWRTKASDCIVQNILERAKNHRGEMYWDPGFRDRSPAARRHLEASLGFGTPGILLFLSEAYAQEPRAELKTAIQAALGRAERLAETNPNPGFYMGNLGALYALSRVRTLLSMELYAQSQIEGLIDESIASCTAGASAVSNGTAGTLLALHMLKDHFPDLDVHSRTLELVNLLIRDSRPTAYGCVCGHQFDAIRNPLGFYAGSSGIRWALSTVKSPALSWLLDGMSRYEDYGFDRESCGWKDFINEKYFQDPKNVERLNTAFSRGDHRPFEQCGKNPGWGAGDAGILLVKMMKEPRIPEHDINEILAELVVSVFFLRKHNEASHCLTLFNGLGGLAITALNACRAKRSDLALKLKNSVLDEAEQQWIHHKRFFTGSWEAAAPLGLLNGESGIGLFLMSIGANIDMTLLYPEPMKSETLAGADLDLVSLKSKFINQAFPYTTKLLNVTLPVAPDAQAVQHALTDSIRNADALTQSLADYEVERLEKALAAPPGPILSFQESFNSEFREQKLQSGRGGELDWKVKRVPFSYLGVLPFGLPSNEPIPQPDCQTLLIQFHHASGFREVHLTPAMYSLLFRLQKPLRVRKLVGRCFQTWPFEEVSKEDLEPLVVSLIRNGLEDGLIVSAG